MKPIDSAGKHGALPRDLHKALRLGEGGVGPLVPCGRGSRAHCADSSSWWDSPSMVQGRHQRDTDCVLSRLRGHFHHAILQGVELPVSGQVHSWIHFWACCPWKQPPMIIANVTVKVFIFSLMYPGYLETALTLLYFYYITTIIIIMIPRFCLLILKCFGGSLLSGFLH